MSKWQPIETAPKDDGVEVIGYGPTAGEISGIDDMCGVNIMSYSGRGDYSNEGYVWSVAGGDYYASWAKPTHWMPLPNPPKEI